ncbi:MAG: polynucleotide adenylyltransferase PcnB, partial [Planctomycetota bacterium]
MPGLLWHESTAAARTSRHLRIPERCSPLTIEPTILSPSSIDFRKLDEDAVRATQRLNQRGFEAYLVGGCVRDLLLGLRPKDYDIATAARPQQVKRTFPRNCRIIGRRFKLAHLHFHGNTKILEVSTFRQMPLADNSENAQPDLLIKHDNEFGNAEEDALRRDFTVNALFLDVGQNCILDYANGLQDLYDRTIRTIGDPRVRFREDPVRILRAAKFAGRLGFHVEPETLAAMAETAPDLVRSAPPRLLEEILRLLRSGHALDSFQLLRDVGALKSLVPVLADFLAVATQPQRVEFWRLLEALDHRVHDGHVPPNPVLLGALLLCPVLLRCAESPHRSPSTVAEELLGPLSVTLRLPRRDSGCLKRICGTAHRFLQLDDTRRFNVAGFSTGPYFDEAFDLFLLRAEATTIDPVLIANWQRIAEDSHAQRRHHSDQPFQNDAGFDDELAAVRPHDARRAPANAPDAPPDEDAGDRVEGEREDGDAAQDRGDSEGTSRRRRRRRRGGRGDEPEQVRRPTERRDEPADPTIGDASESGFESDEREVEGDTDGGDSQNQQGEQANQQGEQAH